MNTFRVVAVLAFVVTGIVSAYVIGGKLRGEGVWRFIGVMACLSLAIRAPSIVEGLFGP